MGAGNKVAVENMDFVDWLVGQRIGENTLAPIDGREGVGIGYRQHVELRPTLSWAGPLPSTPCAGRARAAKIVKSMLSVSNYIVAFQSAIFDARTSIANGNSVPWCGSYAPGGR